MKTTIITILLGVLFVTKGQSQGMVKGSVRDSSSNEPVQETTVSIIKSEDRTFQSYTLSDKLGRFEFKNIPHGDYLLVISAQGYAGRNFPFSITTNNRLYSLEEIKLSKEYKTLEEATVTSSMPVRFKDDSISFKLEYFKTPEGATLEDALKKLPGIQVQKDGSIKAMGETVQKLYVDGKEFFGNNPSIAAKNLAADMVDQVQVFDDLSEQAKFTKIDDGTRTKSINIRLKKDRKTGTFGKLNASSGTDKRYDHGASWNHFNESRKISVIGSASNTNKQPIDPGGNGNVIFSNGNANAVITRSPGSTGINLLKSTGFNFNDTWSKIDFRSNYQFTENKFAQQAVSYRKNIFSSDSASENNSETNSLTGNKVHRFNPRIEYSIDSFHSVLYTGNISFQNGNLEKRDSLFGLAWGRTPYLASIGSSFRSDTKDNFTYSGEFLYRARFRKPGRTFTIAWKNSINTINNRNDLNSLISNLDAAGSIIQLINIDQKGQQESDSRNNSIHASFTNPAGRNQLIELNYSYSSSFGLSDKKTFDYNSVSGKYDEVNLSQTNYFDFTSQTSRAGLNFRAVKKKLNYQLGSGVQFSEIRNRNIHLQTSKDTVIRQRFTNFFPSANLSYTFSRKSNLRISYRGRTNMPSLLQLQDVTDLTNPLFIRIGNPLLKQEFYNDYNLNYNYFNYQNLLLFNVAVTINTTTNKIVNSIDSSGPVQLIIKPENLNGSLSGTLSCGAGFPVKKIKGLSLNYNLMSMYNKDPSLVFEKKFFTKLLVIEQSLGLNYMNVLIDLSLAGSLTYNKVDYEVEQKATEFFKFSWNTDLRLRMKRNIYLINTLEQLNHIRRTPGFNASIFIWNAAIAKKFLKQNAGEIRLTAYDILKQDKGITRTANENYIEDNRYKVTPGYFLLGFTYNFRHSPKNNRKPANDQPKTYFK